MSKTQRIITFSLWSVLLLTMVGVVVGKLWLPRHAERSAVEANLPPALYPAPEFNLIDQDAKPLSNTDLLGRPWIAAFIFTQCASICPRITQTMADLQPRLPEGARMISFSVDPKYDTPAVLKAYAVAHHADERRWRFLTGTSEQIARTAAGMKIPVEPARGADPIGHSDKLVLIDGAGNIRAYYDSNDPVAISRLIADTTALASAPAARQPGARP